MLKGKHLICPILIGALSLSILSGCSASKKKAMFEPGTNLAAGLTGQTEDGTTVKNGFTGKAGTSYTLTFPQATQINTVILREAGEKCMGFRIEALIDGAFTTVHEQDDRIGEYRYCAFPAVTTPQLRVTVLGADANFSIESVSVYNVEQKPADAFRVTTYITLENAYDKELLLRQAGSMAVITDVIFIGSAYFDADGSVRFKDLEVEGSTVSGEEAFKTSVANIREMTGGRDIRLHCNFLGPNPPDGTEDYALARCDLHNEAMGANRDRLVEQVLSIAQQYEFDGIYFDYEYPKRFKDWYTYTGFLKALRKAADGRYELGAAVPVWKNLWESMMIAPLDYAELMGYDCFDNSGYHATFSSTASGMVAGYDSLGIDRSKMDLGIPFYARPVDSGAFWDSYASEADKLGKYSNIAEGPIGGVQEDGTVRDTARYYNSYQMVYDKTAYAIDAGMAGVMTWNYSYDLPYEEELALFRAIAQAIEDRTA